MIVAGLEQVRDAVDVLAVSFKLPASRSRWRATRKAALRTNPLQTCADDRDAATRPPAPAPSREKRLSARPALVGSSP
jgi:hypothetical protein